MGCGRSSLTHEEQSPPTQRQSPSSLAITSPPSSSSNHDPSPSSTEGSPIIFFHLLSENPLHTPTTLPHQPQSRASWVTFGADSISSISARSISVHSSQQGEGGSSPTTTLGLERSFTNLPQFVFTEARYGWSIEYPYKWKVTQRKNSTNPEWEGFDVSIRCPDTRAEASVRISGCVYSEGKEEKRRNQVHTSPHALTTGVEAFGGVNDAFHYVHEISLDVRDMRLEGYLLKKGDMLIEVVSCVNMDEWPVKSRELTEMLSSFRA
eukprot:PhF_6_TR28130/c0_g1_i1/m.41620